MDNGYIYRLETPSDWRAAEVLTREAFWNVYQPGCVEHYIVHRLRGNPSVVEALNCVCIDGGRLCGHIFWTRSRIAAVCVSTSCSSARVEASWSSRWARSPRSGTAGTCSLCSSTTARWAGGWPWTTWAAGRAGRC